MTENKLQDFKDQIARMLYGMTVAQAHEQRVCISCKQFPVVHDEIEQHEYAISGLCGKCFDEIREND